MPLERLAEIAAPKNVSITEIEYDGGEARIVRYNLSDYAASKNTESHVE